MTPVDSVRDDERVVRLTEREALANVRAVLELCAAGELRCSDKTSRPTAATIRTIDAHLVHGDFYADERIATVAWPLLVQAGGLAKLDGTGLQPGRASAPGIIGCHQFRTLLIRYDTGEMAGTGSAGRAHGAPLRCGRCRRRDPVPSS